MIDYEQVLGTPYGLPPWLIERLEDCPAAGCGVHREWMPSVVNALAHFVEADEAVEIVKEYMTRDPNPENEVESTVDYIYGAKDYDCSGYVRKEKPAKEYDPEKMWELWVIYRNSIKVLRSLSSPVPEYWDCLHKLYPNEDDLICIGGPNVSDDGKTRLDGYYAVTVGWPEIIAANVDLSALPLIVPNPMRAVVGTTKAGRESYRSIDNAAVSRRYLVMDFDLTLDGPFGDVIKRVTSRKMFGRGLSAREAVHALTAAVILWLKSQTQIPLIMVVDSGGKSLHAWWYVEGVEEPQQVELFNKAATLGADPAIFNSNNQFVRMPGGTRELTGAYQEVIYWNV